jgi:hypothetical protein
MVYRGIMTKRIVLVVLLCSVAFAKDRSARLYNLTTGEVATIIYHGGHSHGTLQTEIKSESLHGEYSTVRGGAMAWGSIYSGGGVANGYAGSVPLSARGSAILTGNKGTVINCEYISGVRNGSGACEDNHGTKYKLMF